MGRGVCYDCAHTLFTSYVTGPNYEHLVHQWDIWHVTKNLIKNRRGKTQKSLSSTRPAGSKKLRNMSRPTLTFYWKMDMYIQGRIAMKPKVKQQRVSLTFPALH